RAWPRARAYVTLTAVGAVLAVLGSAPSTHPWLAAASTVLVVSVIRFIGFFGGPYAASVSPAITAFVLGATIPGPASAIPDRVMGWVLAGAAATVAALVILPRRDHRVVSAAALRACDTIADAFEARRGADSLDAARTNVAAALAELRRVAATYRRQSPSTHDMALTFLIDQLRL